jgi:hypothetical protein
VDQFIFPMRKAFPLVADAIDTTKTGDGTSIPIRPPPAPARQAVGDTAPSKQPHANCLIMMARINHIRIDTITQSGKFLVLHCISEH